MKKSNKIKEFFKDLLTSIYKTSSLFKFAIYKWVTPFIVFVIVATVMCLPTLISYNRLSAEFITSNVSYSDKVLSHILSQDIKCSINDSKLVCDENYSYNELYEFTNGNGDTIKYKIYINTNISDVDFSVGEFGQHGDNDNYFVFFQESFRYRYTYHNPRTEKVEQNEALGAYTNLNNLDFHQIYLSSLQAENQDEYLINVSNNIILEGYKVLAYEAMTITIITHIGMYLCFMAVVSLLMKGNYLLSRNKGFKFTQALKISIISSIQSLLIALILWLVAGFNLTNAFGLALTIRSMYIYIKYTASRKNISWLDDMYKLTNDERFKVVND